ncbi:unnamed protein product, partial [marine sediment metagenome]
ESAEQTVIVASNISLIVDGKLDDKIWQNLEILNLKPAEPAVTDKGAANFRVVLRGNHLCLGSFIPEPGGKVIARSIGHNPIWHRNPPAEDMLIYEMKFIAKSGVESKLRLEINPWGAHRIMRNGELVQETKILIAANVTSEGWEVETAVPLDELNLDESSNRIKINISQSRCQRPVTPFLYWSLPSRDNYIEFFLPRKSNKKPSITAPRFDPPFLGPKDPPLQVGYVQVVPSIDTEWDDLFWKRVPVITLPRDEPNPR